jgi:DNA-binding MarR family transcriptional regulator
MSQSWEEVEARLLNLLRIWTSFHRANKSVEERLGLSIVQFHLLRTLRDHPGISSLDLARSVGLHPSTLTQSLRRLLRKEFVFISKDPRDSRRKILTATRRGYDALQRFTDDFPTLMGKDLTLKEALRARS